jgi:hypothetical protein
VTQSQATTPRPPNRFLKFEPDQSIHEVSRADVAPHGSRVSIRTYFVAFLCEQNDSVAIILDFIDSPLNGEEDLVVLHRGADGWKRVWSQNLVSS